MGDIYPCGPARHVSWAAAADAAGAAGFERNLAYVMAAIGAAESSLNESVINDTPATGDYSVGVWQVNYYGALYAGRAREFGTPCQLVRSGVTGQARAAFAIYRGQGLSAWSTYSNGAYKQYLHGYKVPPGATQAGTYPGLPQEPRPRDWSAQVKGAAYSLRYGAAAMSAFGRAIGRT
jgi:Lysozyme like domain